MPRAAGPPPRVRRGAVTGLLLAALTVTGCSADAPAAPPAPAGSSAAASPPARPRPAPRPPSGLTGFPAGIGRPQLAVKIDNTRSSHPQAGVAEADIVYVEVVETQLTRLLAIFSSRLPAEVGPVRSARETDLDLLRPFGRINFAFSGANRGVLSRIAAAPVNALSEVSAGAAFYRSGNRRRPYNLYLRPDRALAAKPAALATDIGLRFAAAVPTAGSPSTGFSIRFGPSTVLAARYDARNRVWRIRMDGRSRPTTSGRVPAPANVIVQYVLVRGSRFRDVLGNVSPFTVTTGTGSAVIFRDGRSLPARWARLKEIAGTRFTDSGGAEIGLRPGQTWILLVPIGTPLGS